MTVDLSQLGTLAGSLARAGLPALSTLLGAVVPPPYDLLVKPAFSAVAWAIGVDPTAPDAVAQVQAKVDADPAAAAQHLQPVEAAHADAAAEVEAYLKDVQDARATDLALAQAGHPMAYAQGALGFFNLALFGYVTWFFLSGHNVDNPNGNLIIGAILGNAATTQAFFLGSSQNARSWAAQAVSYAAKVLPGKVPVRR